MLNTLQVYMNEHEVCAVLFFFSLHIKHLCQHSQPAALKWGKCRPMFPLLPLPALSCVLRVCCFAPCSSPGSSEQDQWGRSGEDYGKGTGLAPEHQHPDCPVPLPPSSLEVSGRARQDWAGVRGGNQVNIFKCLRYVLVLNQKDKAFYLISQPAFVIRQLLRRMYQILSESVIPGLALSAEERFYFRI